MISRRQLISALPALGSASLLSLPDAFAAAHSATANSGDERITLETGWGFRLDPDGAAHPSSTSSHQWQSIRVPHTWQSLGGSPDYVGVAWYRLELFAPTSWQASFVRVEFEAVFHTAHIFLNGAAIGRHIGKGYTAFTCDLSPQLRYGASNELLVRADNSFGDAMLPRMKSFDWANDGGIVRPVSLLITPPVFLEQIAIDAIPDVAGRTAEIAIHTVLRNTLTESKTATLSALIASPDPATPRALFQPRTVELPPQSRTILALDAIHIESPLLWHFDSPHLYWAEAAIDAGPAQHTLGDQFGIRKFDVRGSSFYLNDERVTLAGVERMAGSHPQYGMAEPAEWIEKNHRDMKELNCIFTRVHWPQDRRVLDFCDRHGILMQSEVPAWGSDTFDKISPEIQAQLEANGSEQLTEMIGRDRNHPCIIAWGLCNEVDGQNPNSRAFATALAAEARKLDPHRLLTYASHSLRDHPEADMAGDFDFISANEYFGSWYPGGASEVRAFLDILRKAFPAKPIVVSEYGWCECQGSIPPGDSHRVTIIDDHTAIFRESSEVAGAIYFDYNDYRTLVGDKGTGAFRQRVHGVVDLYAQRKPSFAALRKQLSPIESFQLSRSGNQLSLHIKTRRTLPAYSLRGYRLRWSLFGYDELPMAGSLQELPTLEPGQSADLHFAVPTGEFTRVIAEIFRPTGFSVDLAELRLQSRHGRSVP